ncbi:MAG: hypothetical protein ACJAZ9_001415 [Neolewinella sp.]
MEGKDGCWHFESGGGVEVLAGVGCSPAVGFEVDGTVWLPVNLGVQDLNFILVRVRRPWAEGILLFANDGF